MFLVILCIVLTIHRRNAKGSLQNHQMSSLVLSMLRKIILKAKIWETNLNYKLLICIVVKLQQCKFLVFRVTLCLLVFMFGLNGYRRIELIAEQLSFILIDIIPTTTNSCLVTDVNVILTHIPTCYISVMNEENKSVIYAYTKRNI